MKTITANRLTDGRVIYRTAEGEWTEDLARAERLADDATAEARLAEAEAEPAIAVGPYLIEIEDDAPGGQKWRREGIRLTGPTTGSTKTVNASRKAA
ncbi:MAG: DUF2849 domain-containing protein [Alphaproteobacteria bacterium]|uniref:DUF2849 domain-containing protein n=1 Tax=Maricaulis alexandrii TaxID=2570354 RepID=UPI001108D5F8|nr:DUF2849 domain-containing protein [Maricaulis alexandrii]MCR9266469.1 DUF2849 domain-containing protein [Alphaproteobacteria bacterium]